MQRDLQNSDRNLHDSTNLTDQKNTQNKILNVANFSKIYDNFSLIYRQFISDGNICHLDGRYLEDKFNAVLNCPTVHLNYVWWLDIKLHFQIYLYELDNFLPSLKNFGRNKILIRPRFYLKFIEPNVSHRRRRLEAFLDKNTKHCSEDLNLGLEMSLVSNSQNLPESQPQISTTRIPKSKSNSNNSKNLQNLEIQKNCYSIYENLTKSSTKFQKNSLNQIVISKYSKSKLNEFIYFEHEDLKLDIDLDTCLEMGNLATDYLDIVCSYQDLDCSEFKSNIDFVFCDLVISEI